MDTSQTFPAEKDVPGSFRKIYELPFKKIFMDPSTKTCITMWNENSRKITEEDYKKDAIDSIGLLVSNGAIKLLADNRENQFAVTPDLQRWYSEKILPMFGEHKVKKCAFLVSDNLLVHHMLDDTSSKAIKLYASKNIEVRFFSDFTEAFKWISK